MKFTLCSEPTQIALLSKIEFQTLVTKIGGRDLRTLSVNLFTEKQTQLFKSKWLKQSCFHPRSVYFFEDKNQFDVIGDALTCQTKMQNADFFEDNNQICFRIRIGPMLSEMP